MVLKFEQFLSLVLENDSALKLAREKLKVAQASLRLSKTGKLPKLSLVGYSGAAQYQGRIPVANSFSLPAKDFSTRPAFYADLGLSLKQVLFDRKQTNFLIQEQAVMLEKIANEVAQTRSAASFRAALISCQMAHAEEKIVCLKQQIGLQEKLGLQTESYLSAGLVRKSEKEMMALHLFELQDLLRTLEWERQELSRGINTMLNLPDNQSPFIVTPHHNIDIDFFQLCLQAQENQSRPPSMELRNAELDVELGVIALKRARAHNAISAAWESQLRYSSARSWVLGFGISLPLWDGGERTALVESAIAHDGVTSMNLEIRKKEIDQKIARSFSRVMLEHERLEALRARIAAYQTQGYTEKNASLGWDETLREMQIRRNLFELSLKAIVCEANFHSASLEFLNVANKIEDCW